MTDDKQRKTPVLRFKGFHDDWEQRKLEEIVKRNTRKNKNLSSTLPLTISAELGLINQTTFFGKRIASKNLSNYLLLKKGDFAYNKSYSSDYPFGAIKRLDKYDKGVISSLYISFYPQKINSDFLKHYYDASKWHREIYKNAAEGARNHGLLNISADDFFNSKIIFPFNKIEQNNISYLLNKIDNLISLQQRKINCLLKIKKALSSTIFDDRKDKSNGPLFEYKEKAQNLFIRITKKNHSKLPVLSATQDKGMIYRDDEEKDIQFEKANLNNYKLVNTNDFVIHLRSFQGGFAYSDKKGIVSPAYTIFRFRKNIGFDSVFWKEKFRSYNFIQLLKKITYGVRDGRNINYSDFLTLYLTFPDENKQKQIGKVFSSLETSILINKTKRNQLECIKQFLLQNMFI